MNGDLKIVEAKPEFRNRIRRKVERYGSKVMITEKTGLSPHIIRQFVYKGKIRRKNLVTIVKWFAGPDVNIDDYIKE